MKDLIMDIPYHNEEHYIPARISAHVFKQSLDTPGVWSELTVLRPAPEGWLNQGRCSTCP